MPKTVKPHSSDDLLKTRDVADLAHVDVSTVNRWVHARRLVPAVKVAGKTGAHLFRRSDVERLLVDQNRNAS